MQRFVVLGSILTIIGALAIGSSRSHAADACVRSKFETKLVKDACTKGGQPAAKDAMKAFMKKAKLKDCKACHSTLAPKYELKADGLAKYTKAGGT